MTTTLENSWSDPWGNFPRCSGIVTSIGEWGQDNEERGWQLQIKQFVKGTADRSRVLGCSTDKPSGTFLLRAVYSKAMNNSMDLLISARIFLSGNMAPPLSV